jgi:hypothetical protein
VCFLGLTSLNVFNVVVGLDKHKQRFISRMIGLANPLYTHPMHTKTGTSSPTPSASAPGSARVSANITTTAGASVSVNTQQRSNEHATALMAALQSQPVHPPSPSHKTSVMNKSFYNFHSSSFYNSKQTTEAVGVGDGMVDAPTAQCVSVVNKEEFDHAVVHLMDWAHTYLTSTHKPTTTNTLGHGLGFLNFAMPEYITIPDVLLRAHTHRELDALVSTYRVSESDRVSINCQFPTFGEGFKTVGFSVQFPVHKTVSEYISVFICLVIVNVEFSIAFFSFLFVYLCERNV